MCSDEHISKPGSIAARNAASVTFDGLTVVPDKKQCIVDGMDVKLPKRNLKSC